MCFFVLFDALLPRWGVVWSVSDASCLPPSHSVLFVSYSCLIPAHPGSERSSVKRFLGSHVLATSSLTRLSELRQASGRALPQRHRVVGAGRSSSRRATGNHRRLRSSGSGKCKRKRSNPERDEVALPIPRVAFTLTECGQSDRSLPPLAPGAAPVTSTRQGYGVANMHRIASWPPTSSFDGSRRDDS